jgi:Flp pilus assembly protein TadG
MSTSGHVPGSVRWPILLGAGQMSAFGSQGQRVDTTRNGARSPGERGAALLEFTFVALLLFTLIFGIISYAYMMSFRQAMTQAAAEASRAAAIAPTGQAQTRALAALNDAISPYGITCSGGSLLRSGNSVGTCSVPSPAGCTSPADTNRCITVSVSYNYRSNPLLPSFPGLGVTLPQTIGFTSVAQVN